MFRGVAQLNLDSKGRLAVPARHREALLARCAGRLVITADSDKCLLLYPLPDWEPIQQKLMALSSLNPRIRDLQRQLVGYAEDMEMDAAGRVLISPALRNFARSTRAWCWSGRATNSNCGTARNGSRRLSRAPVSATANLPPELEGFSL